MVFRFTIFAERSILIIEEEQVEIIMKFAEHRRRG